MKKGFTLIELLAVIVILAIIALIAAPIILNIIGNAKDESNERSKELYLRAVNQAIAARNLTEEFNPSECTIQEDGNLLCGKKNLLVEVSGTKPCSGTITFDKKGKIASETVTYCNGENNSIVEKNTLVDGPTFNSIISGLEIKPKIIEFLSNGRIPDGMTREELLSLEKVEGLSEDGSIIGYAKDVTVEDKTTRTLYIYSDNLISFNEDSSEMFSSLLSVNEIIFNEVDTSKVTNMSKMFYFHGTLDSLDLSSFDTHNVTDMSYMFYGFWLIVTNNLESIKFGENFDTSKVTDMSYMFGNDTQLTDLDISGFNTSSVTDMKYMFYYCKKLTTLDLRNFDTSKVTDMSYMFGTDEKLTDLDISEFDTSSVTNMSDMFNGCSSLTELNINNFNTKNVTNMSRMFSSSSNLLTLDLTNFDISNVEDIGSIFSGTTALTQVLVSRDKWIYKDGLDTTSMFNSSNISSVTYKD